MEKIFSLYNEYMIKNRRWLHMYPETGFNEIKTQEYICEELKKLTIPFRTVSTGVIADIFVGAKETIAFRADMDALTIQEENNLEYCSLNKGIMHACGHDGHMAMLLGLAKFLIENPQKNVNVRLIFQPAEEGDGGAVKMIEGGALKDVSKIFAFHIDPKLEYGEIGVCTGANMAGAVEFDIQIEGVSVHAANKEEGIDALKVCMQIYEGIQAIEAKQAKKENMLLHVGKIEGGSARNIVANRSKLFCTLRYFNDRSKRIVMEMIQKELTWHDKVFGTVSKIIVNSDFIPVVNHDSALGIVSNAVEKIDDVNIVKILPRYTAEDFAFYVNEVEGALIWLGAKMDIPVALHSSNFNFNEDALSIGLETFVNIIKIF